MHHAGRDLLAAAGRAVDEHAGAGGGDALDGGAEGGDGRAAAGELGIDAGAQAELGVLARQLGGLERARRTISSRRSDLNGFSMKS